MASSYTRRDGSGRSPSLRPACAEAPCQASRPVKTMLPEPQAFGRRFRTERRPSARSHHNAPGSFGRLRQRHRAGFHLPTMGSEPPANDVKGRREDQSERRNTDHAGEDRGAERLPELGSSAGRPNQWHDTENEGERGHQDRPQPQPRGFRGGGTARTAPVLELLSELDDQARILRG